MTGIYAIANAENGKKYVGQSVNPTRRMNTHFCKLRKNEHPSMHLQAAFNKYGESAFSRIVLEECEQEAATEKEDFWIFTLGAEYNKRPATAASNLGLVMSSETRKRQAASLREACASPEARARLAETSRKGWEQNREERIAKIKDVWTPEKKAEFSKQMAARPGAREAALAAQKQRWKDPEQHASASATAKRLHAEGRLGVGKKHTEDEIRALVESLGWEAREIQGTQMKDRVLVYCLKHDHEQSQTVRKIIHNHRGCRECGWDRVRKAA